MRAALSRLVAQLLPLSGVLLLALDSLRCALARCFSSSWKKRGLPMCSSPGEEAGLPYWGLGQALFVHLFFFLDMPLNI